MEPVASTSKEINSTRKKHQKNSTIHSKIMDYFGDVENLFAKTRSMHAEPTFNYTQSPFQSTIVNRSSSSADSTSPESYLDNSLYTRQNYDRFNIGNRPITPKNAYETPKLSYESPTPSNLQYGSFTNIYDPTLDTSFQNLETTSIYEPFTQTHDYGNLRRTFETPQPMRRQYPIAGRKILGRNPTKLENKITEEEIENSWQTDRFGQTPPEIQKTYELFPSDRGFKFSSPIPPANLSPGYNSNIKSTSPMNSSPTYNPRMPNSPSWSPTVQSNLRPYRPFTNTACGSNKDIGDSKMCTFCRKNGETPIVYMTHSVKEKQGNAYVVTCPILRSHVCSICGSSGDNAHTLTYCPILRRNNDGKPLKSTTITLKNTRIKSNGRRRY